MNNHDDALSMLSRQPVPQHLPAVPHGLAKVAIVLAVALTVFQLVIIAIHSVPAPAAWAWDVLTLITLAAIGTIIAVYLVGTLWLLRSYDFAKLVDPAFPMRRSRSWTWLGWWVPIVSLWFPFQIVDDVRRATAKGEARPSPTLWWAAWLIATWAPKIPMRDDGGVLINSRDAVSAVAMVVACVTWISIIRGITRDQDAARG
ncbi:DUF4328 domain-containing protein [Nocardioides sp. KC13]|uniref:DUF4328 domain-containing protein n=1 Tax=Nocardioides turkmenicus TaxID=2711220 RepID=A0A6M1R942_9ACTN|nr:DUF4328 domain-containing protein [Nocardioides sp. KC13]NGN95151.1 DUF4328 domain-containing protein [Nocardioides sp. KC13]